MTDLDKDLCRLGDDGCPLDGSPVRPGLFHLCRCDCGGEVFGVEQFGMIFSACEQCTPHESLSLD